MALVSLLIQACKTFILVCCINAFFDHRNQMT